MTRQKHLTSEFTGYGQFHRPESAWNDGFGVLPAPTFGRERNMIETDGWNYAGKPVAGEDARKLVTLTEGGMVWVGIRAWHGTGGYWMNGGEPERATVKAWRDMPAPAAGFWDRGNLHVPKTPNVKVTGSALPNQTKDEANEY